MNGFGKMRKAAKMTQQAASDASGIPLSTLRRWEQGVNEPDVASIALLADLYGCTTDELLDIDVVRMSSHSANAEYGLLSDDERHLVECFRACTPEWRRTLLRSAEAKPESAQTVQTVPVARRFRHRRVIRAQRNRHRDAGAVRFLAISRLRRSVSDANPGKRCAHVLNRKPV